MCNGRLSTSFDAYSLSAGGSRYHFQVGDSEGFVNYPPNFGAEKMRPTVTGRIFCIGLGIGPEEVCVAEALLGAGMPSVLPVLRAGPEELQIGRAHV